MKNLAIIPARGEKNPEKEHKFLKPIIAYSIEAAESNLFDEVMVQLTMEK